MGSVCRGGGWVRGLWVTTDSLLIGWGVKCLFTYKVSTVPIVL